MSAGDGTHRLFVTLGIAGGDDHPLSIVDEFWHGLFKRSVRFG
ncbi:hypothetical protein [Saccharomonospora iraqiensis]|nr:hypothetical protein [Saccharomonospora iraqiensis]